MIVLDRVARPKHPRRFQPRDGGHESELNLFGQRSRNAIGIDGRIIETFRLEENLVSVALAETNDLVLD